MIHHSWFKISFNGGDRSPASFRCREVPPVIPDKVPKIVFYPNVVFDKAPKIVFYPNVVPDKAPKIVFYPNVVPDKAPKIVFYPNVVPDKAPKNDFYYIVVPGKAPKIDFYLMVIPDKAPYCLEEHGDTRQGSKNLWKRPVMHYICLMNPELSPDNTINS